MFMDDQNTEARLVVSFSEMLEDQGGLYRMGEVNVFDASAERNSGAAGANLSPEQAVATWVEWMSAWGCGLVFSVTPMGGGERQVYAVMLGGEWMQCNGLRGDWGGRG